MGRPRTGRNHCTVSGCDQVVHGHGYCKLHYERRRAGTALTRPKRMVMRGATAAELFEARVSRDVDGCWTWTGARFPNNYGLIVVPDGGHGRTKVAHRVAYELHVGPIPAGLQIDHLCGNRPCVNPAHLEPVTAQENSRRSPKPLATHCKRGHGFTEENTYQTTYGARQCRECERARARERSRKLVRQRQAERAH